MSHVEALSDQRGHLPRYRNFQHGRLGFAPCLDRGFLDVLEIVEAGRVAPVSFRNGNNVKAGDVETWNSSVSPRVPQMI